MIGALRSIGRFLGWLAAREELPSLPPAPSREGIGGGLVGQLLKGEPLPEAPPAAPPVREVSWLRELLAREPLAEAPEAAPAAPSSSGLRSLLAREPLHDLPPIPAPPRTRWWRTLLMPDPLPEPGPERAARGPASTGSFLRWLVGRDRLPPPPENRGASAESEPEK